jgi:hypothetical protein
MVQDVSVQKIVSADPDDSRDVHAGCMTTVSFAPVKIALKVFHQPGKLIQDIELEDTPISRSYESTTLDAECVAKVPTTVNLEITGIYTKIPAAMSDTLKLNLQGALYSKGHKLEANSIRNFTPAKFQKMQWFLTPDNNFQGIVAGEVELGRGNFLFNL